MRTPVWPIFVTYAGAVVATFVLSVFAWLLVKLARPQLDLQKAVRSAPGILAGALASSAALLLGAGVLAYPFFRARLRLARGRQTTGQLVAMVVCVLVIRSGLDCLASLIGLGSKGLLATSKAFSGASLLLSVAAFLILGLLAGTAQEIFFRGAIQTRLRQRWGVTASLIVTSLLFGLIHLEPAHALLAFFLGLYLGWVTEISASVRPAMVCHVSNNLASTIFVIWGRFASKGWLLPVYVAVAAAGILFLRKSLSGDRALPTPGPPDASGMATGGSSRA